VAGDNIGLTLAISGHVPGQSSDTGTHTSLFIYQDTSTWVQRSNLFGLRVKLPPVLPLKNTPLTSKGLFWELKEIGPAEKRRRRVDFVCRIDTGATSTQRYIGTESRSKRRHRVCGESLKIAGDRVAYSLTKLRKI